MIKKITVLTILILTLRTLSYAQMSFGPEKGWLVIDGGQEPLLPVIARRFVALAGGPEANIILVPTAMNSNGKKFTEQVETYETWLGAKHITVLHTRDRAVANTEAFVEPLRKANGVWFTGGWEGYLEALCWHPYRTKTQSPAGARRSSRRKFCRGLCARNGCLVPPNGLRPGFSEELKGFGFLRNTFIIPHVIEMDWENRMAEGMTITAGPAWDRG